MVFQVTRQQIWFKIKDLHGTVSPNQPNSDFRSQAEEALFDLLETTKENVHPAVLSKIDTFLNGFVQNVRRWVL